MWLDPERTSPYEFYQFWINADDRDVVAFLGFSRFTICAAIEALEASPRAERPRLVRRSVTLAIDVTRRGCTAREQVARAEHASTVLFGEDIATLRCGGRAGGVRGCAVDGTARR